MKDHLIFLIKIFKKYKIKIYNNVRFVKYIIIIYGGRR